MLLMYTCNYFLNNASFSAALGTFVRHVPNVSPMGRRLVGCRKVDRLSVENEERTGTTKKNRALKFTRKHIQHACIVASAYTVKEGKVFFTHSHTFFVHACMDTLYMAERQLSSIGIVWYDLHPSKLTSARRGEREKTQQKATSSSG